jgi:hypothetical protein
MNRTAISNDPVCEMEKAQNDFFPTNSEVPGIWFGFGRYTKPEKESSLVETASSASTLSAGRG